MKVVRVYRLFYQLAVHHETTNNFQLLLWTICSERCGYQYEETMKCACFGMHEH